MTCGTVKNVSYSLTLYLAIAFMILIAVGIILIAALVRRPRSDWHEAVRNQTEDVRQSGMAGFQQNRIKPRTVSFEEIWERDSVYGSAYIGAPRFPENVQEVKEQVIARWVIPEVPPVKTDTAPLPIVPSKDKAADSAPPLKGWGSMPTNSVIWITPSSRGTDEEADDAEAPRFEADDAEAPRFEADDAGDPRFEVPGGEETTGQVEPDTETDSSAPAVEEGWTVPAVPPLPPPPPPDWFVSEEVLEKPKVPRSIFKPLSVDNDIELGVAEGDLDFDEIDSVVATDVESDDVKTEVEPAEVDADFDQVIDSGFEAADCEPEDVEPEDVEPEGDAPVFDSDEPDVGDELMSAEIADIAQPNSVDVEASDIVHVPTSPEEESSTESLQPIAGFDFDDFDSVEVDASTYEPFGAWLSKHKESSTTGLSLNWQDYMPRWEDITASDSGTADEGESADVDEDEREGDEGESVDESDESHEEPNKN